MKRSIVALCITAVCAATAGRAPAADQPAAKSGTAPAAAKPAAGGAKKADAFTGFANAPFGTSYEDVRKLFPKATPIAEGEDLGSPTIGGPYLTRLLLKDQPVQGLAMPTMVELRFWKKKLWVAVVYFGANPDKDVVAMLTAKLGPSEGGDETNPLWEGDKVTVVAELRQRWYAANDKALSGAAQEWFKRLLNGDWKGPSDAEVIELGLATPVPSTPAAAAATPAAATPAAATPAAGATK